MKRMAFGLVVGIVLLASAAQPAAADSLVPPSSAFDQDGKPVSTMKSLDQIEPRKAILSLPFSITNAGSFYLAGNLRATATNVAGIIINSSDVQLDLNGFAIIGIPGSLDGIKVLGTNENINICNGSIREWDGFGINAIDANDGSVLEVKANRNGRGGIVYGDGAMVERCSAYGNGYKAPLPPQYVPPASTNANSDMYSEPGDMMPDWFEQQIIDKDPNDNITSYTDVHPWDDFDGDGVANQTELWNNTNPTDGSDGDADGDWLPDNWELAIVNANPTDNITSISNVFYSEWSQPAPPFGETNTWDFDLDGSSNGDEYWRGTSPTNPLSVDSDYDYMNDAFEMAIVNASGTDTVSDVYQVYGWDDFDNDGFSNQAEYDAGSNPVLANSTPYTAAGNEQTEYAAYTNVEETAMMAYEEFNDPTDEASDDGIRAGRYSTVKECKARGNRGTGVLVKYGSRVLDCTTARNMVDGVFASDYGTVLGCTVARNNKNGITVVSKCLVQENNCGQNGDYMQNNMVAKGAGIRIVGEGNRVENNNICGNAIGIQVDNMFANQFGNAAGTSASENLIIGNSSVDNWGASFDLATGDYMGGEYGSSMSTNKGMMDASNPFSNFQF